MQFISIDSKLMLAENAQPRPCKGRFGHGQTCASLSHLSKSGYRGALTYKMVQSHWLPIVVWPQGPLRSQNIDDIIRYTMTGIRCDPSSPPYVVYLECLDQLNHHVHSKNDQKDRCCKIDRFLIMSSKTFVNIQLGKNHP